VKQLLAERNGLLVVSGLGSATFDVAAADDNPLNFYLWGAMGSAAMVGLGLALARPSRRVAVITGDGEMLMGLGSFATIGVQQPKNLVVVVLDNQHYGETGMQKSHMHSGISLVDIAQACLFKQSRVIARPDEVGIARKMLHDTEGPALIHVLISTKDNGKFLPEKDGAVLFNRFVRALEAEQPQ
jgi:thiamine pyrophosphate-dependent acetolactate synthase large subunit-like protein